MADLFFEARLQVRVEELRREVRYEFFANKNEQLEAVSNDARDDYAFEDSCKNIAWVMNHQVDARTRDEHGKNEQHSTLGFFHVIFKPEEHDRGH